MTVKTKIRRQGGAAVVTIPPALLKLMHIEIGDHLSLAVSNGELIAKPVLPEKKRLTLKELLQGADALTELNAAVADAQDGDAVGREIF